ncbi:MAG: DUF3999 family protein [Bacteroidota bacterium]
MTKTFSFLFLACLLSLGRALGQMDTYSYKQPLRGIQEPWHGIPVPDALFRFVNSSMNDIRIYGITENDTLEAPYHLLVHGPEKTRQKIDFNRLNTSSNALGHHVTFEVPSATPINTIYLDFKAKNFDWRISLDASDDAKQWYTLLTDYRILSINNEQTDYQFTELHFPRAQYTYYRILIQTDTEPMLEMARIYSTQEKKAQYRAYPKTTTMDEEGKNTVITVDLPHRFPVSFLEVQVNGQTDYYRPVRIDYMMDSLITEKGIKYRYAKLTQGLLTSRENTGFPFASTLTQKLRITIQNQDNRPLKIDGIQVKGYVHELVARFDNPASYYLVYGKERDLAPRYDITKANSLPKNPTLLTLGNVSRIPKTPTLQQTPLFENKIWLWAVMGAVIVVLGFFTLRMLRAN